MITIRHREVPRARPRRALAAGPLLVISLLYLVLCLPGLHAGAADHPNAFAASHGETHTATEHGQVAVLEETGAQVDRTSDPIHLHHGTCGDEALLRSGESRIVPASAVTALPSFHASMAAGTARPRDSIRAWTWRSFAQQGRRPDDLDGTTLLSILCLTRV